MLDGADADGRDRSSDLAEQLLQTACYLSVPADRDQMHSVECARVAELDDLIIVITGPMAILRSFGPAGRV